MINNIVARKLNGLQDNFLKEGKVQQLQRPQQLPYWYTRPFINFVHSLIREHGTLDINDGYSLFVSALPYHDKKLFLSYILNVGDYEHYIIKSPTLEREAIDEYAPIMQQHINECLDEVYHEDMEEMGRARR